jgi:orotidine-5'-phosphate decarboxylase
VARHFADRLAGLVAARESQLVLGLDPDPLRLWPEAVRAGTSSPGDVRERTAAAVARHCRAAIEAAGPRCVAVKAQLACFERLGPPGWAALEAAAGAAREHGLLFLADAKRGDVPVTAAAYAQALVGETPGPYGTVHGLGADAFTASTLLGRDSLLPLIDAADAAGAGAFCLVRTSNPGAGDVQDLAGPHGPVHERLAAMVDELGRGRTGESGLSSVGAVCGATWPGLLPRLRELMPRAVFLLPGVGAQGGAVGGLAAAWRPHPAAGLVAASRSVVDAHRESGGPPARAAERAAEGLRRAAWALAGG